jgi:diguanylate cyclase (GGDEF)-like protein
MVGDSVLREVARRLAASLRSYDYLGRYGGEEFLIIVPSCDAASLGASAERLRACISDSPIQTAAGPIAATLSLGTVSTQGWQKNSMPGYEALVRASDSALYNAKANGRNRVETAVLCPTLSQPAVI